MLESGRRKPSRFRPRNGTSRSSKKPASYAAASLWWLSSANRSCASRAMCHSFAICSQWSPIDLPVRGSATPGNDGFSSPSENPRSATFSLSSGVLARFIASSRLRRRVP